MTNPIEKFETRAKNINSLLCVGLDPEVSKIPDRYRTAEYAQFEFNKFIIEQTHEYAASYKPNAAFYEAEGAKGIESLKKTCDYLKENHPDVFIILDAKRGDIGNTNLGYAKFAYDYLGVDALTFQPYLGKESMSEVLNREDKALIILAKTSNVGSGEFQDLVVNGKKIWESVVENVSTKWNEHNNVMIVIGATYPEELQRAREIAPNITFLVPGIGAQGGDVEATVRAGLNKEKMGIIINSSRGIIFAENPREEAKKLRDEINLYR
jgi:orotidine 5'-phosphate decarboxylase subfamily 2